MATRTQWTSQALQVESIFFGEDMVRVLGKRRRSFTTRDFPDGDIFYSMSHRIFYLATTRGRIVDVFFPSGSTSFTPLDVVKLTVEPQVFSQTLIDGKVQAGVLNKVQANAMAREISKASGKKVVPRKTKVRKTKQAD